MVLGQTLDFISNLEPSYFYSKMLRSLQTSKNSTSTLSCLLVPAVAMIKGMSLTHFTQRFPLCFSAFLSLSLSHTRARGCFVVAVITFWHCCLIACPKFKALSTGYHTDTVWARSSQKFNKIDKIMAVWLIIKQTTDICRLLLYLAVCVSFVSPYLFITPTPKFYPFGLRMRGGPPLLDYGIKVSVLTRHDAYKSRTPPHQIYSPLHSFQWSEFHVLEPYSTDVCFQLDTESPRRAPRDLPPEAGGVRWIQVSARLSLWMKGTKQRIRS